MGRKLPAGSFGNDSSFATEMSKIHANSINVPQLAALVKERDGIWNRQHGFYRKRTYWNQAWLEIAKEMFPRYDQMSIGEQIETVKVLKSKWKNLRLTHLKFLKEKQDPSHRISTFRYQKEFEFMRSENMPVKSSAPAKNTSNRNSPDVEQERAESEVSRSSSEKSVRVSRNPKKRRKSSSPSQSRSPSRSRSPSPSSSRSRSRSGSRSSFSSCLSTTDTIDLTISKSTSPSSPPRTPVKPIVAARKSTAGIYPKKKKLTSPSLSPRPAVKPTVHARKSTGGIYPKKRILVSPSSSPRPVVNVTVLAKKSTAGINPKKRKLASPSPSPGPTVKPTAAARKSAAGIYPKNRKCSSPLESSSDESINSRKSESASPSSSIGRSVKSIVRRMSQLDSSSDSDQSETPNGQLLNDSNNKNSVENAVNQVKCNGEDIKVAMNNHSSCPQNESRNPDTAVENDKPDTAVLNGYRENLQFSSFGVQTDSLLDSYNEEVAFYRSLNTWTKKFNDYQKLQYRSGIMTLIQQILIDDAETSEPYMVVSREPWQ